MSFRASEILVDKWGVTELLFPLVPDGGKKTIPLKLSKDIFV